MSDKSDTPRTVPDGCWEALQRLIEDAMLRGPASREDASAVNHLRGYINDIRRELAEARADLQFVERWANHHGAKPSCTAEEALSVIQHYPPIKAITESYEDGKVPDTRNPWAELAAVTEERDALAAAMPSEGADAALAYAAEKTLREKAEAECERLRDALQVCLSYWLSDANPDELQGSVAHMKHISGFAAAIDAARRK